MTRGRRTLGYVGGIVLLGALALMAGFVRCGPQAVHLASPAPCLVEVVQPRPGVELGTPTPLDSRVFRRSIQLEPIVVAGPREPVLRCGNGLLLERGVGLSLQDVLQRVWQWLHGLATHPLAGWAVAVLLWTAMIENGSPEKRRWMRGERG